MALNFSLSWNGPQVTAATQDAASNGLKLAAEHLLTESLKVVPIEEGTLQNSGRAEVDGLTAGVGYDTPYAVIQHEDLTFQHDAGRTAKYLERPMNEQRDTMLAIVAAQIRGAIG